MTSETLEMQLPARANVAFQEILTFLRKSSIMRSPSIIALRLARESIGEEAIRIALRLTPDAHVLFMPPTALRSHDINALKEAVRFESARFLENAEFNNDLTLWQTIRHASSQIKNSRLAIWLNLTGVPIKNWPIWRIAIEEELCSVIIVCTKSQWTKAGEEIPELVDCVFQVVDLDGFLAQEDISHLARILNVYVTTDVPKSVVDHVARALSSQNLDSFSEIDFERLIWEAMKGGM